MYLTPSPVAISEAVAVCLQRKVCEGGWVVFYFYLYTERYGYILLILLTAPKVWILSLISAFKRSIGSNFEFIYLHTICDTIYYTSTIVKRSTFYEWEYYYYLATHGKEWRIHWPVKPWRCSLLKDDFLFFWPYTLETRSWVVRWRWLVKIVRLYYQTWRLFARRPEMIGILEIAFRDSIVIKNGRTDTNLRQRACVWD